MHIRAHRCTDVAAVQTLHRRFNLGSVTEYFSLLEASVDVAWSAEITCTVVLEDSSEREWRLEDFRCVVCCRCMHLFWAQTLQTQREEVEHFGLDLQAQDQFCEASGFSQMHQRGGSGAKSIREANRLPQSLQTGIHEENEATFEY